MDLTTDAIGVEGWIDPRYTGDYDNSSPELRWTEGPAGTACYALVAEDPDAPSGLFSHWVVHHIPSSIHHLPAGIPPQETLPNGIRQGTNDFGKLGYGGPFPPLGDRAHRYLFRLYALSASPEIPTRATRAQLLDLIRPHVLAEAHCMGIYQRTMQSVPKAG